MKIQLILLLLLCMSISAYSQTKENDLLKKINKDWLAAESLKDSKTLNKIMSNDFKLITDRGQQLSKRDYINSIILSPGKITFEIDSVTVEVYANSALVTNYLTTTINEKPAKNCTSTLFIKRDDNWQAVSLFIMLLRNLDK